MPEYGIGLAHVHLNFVGRCKVDKLCNTIRSTRADAILTHGDIATSLYLCCYLESLAVDLQRLKY